MKKGKIIVFVLSLFIMISCNEENKKDQRSLTQITKEVTAKEILGNPDYLAISYGGYRKTTRGIQPTITEIKEDMKILHAMNIKILRTNSRR